MLLFAIGAYLAGSIPFGLLVARFAGAPDPRSHGSGNIGATNLTRTAGRAAGLATLVLDAGKGAAVVVAAKAISPESLELAALAAFLGHMFPLWLGFRGGKGVAVMLGEALFIDWRIGLGICVVWLSVAALSRYASLAGLVVCVAAPVLFALTDQSRMALLFSAMGLLLVRAHRGNIARLLAGTERRIGERAGVAGQRKPHS